MRPDLPDEELERRLRGLEPDWPTSPDVSGDVTEELLARERLGMPPRRPPARPRPAWALPAAAAALLLLTAFATVAVIRAGGIAIDLVDGAPSGPRTLQPFPASFGERTTLADAPELAGFIPIYPEELGAPDVVWVDRVVPVDGGDPVARVAMAWEPGDALPPIVGARWGALLFESRGDAITGSKRLLEGVHDLRATRIDGQDGYFAAGPHPIDLETSAGPVTYEVNGNVLVWNEGDYAMRFESLLSHRDSVRVAESV